jgi:hypothetical protein
VVALREDADPWPDGKAWSVTDEATRLAMLLQREMPEIAQAIIRRALVRAYRIGMVDQIWRDDDDTDDPDTLDPEPVVSTQGHP